ncbi:MAG: patatin-like phospholipase family protein [Chloroflexota bacterium]
MNQQWTDILPRPITFVLSGGSSLGAIQVGMVRALRDNGIYPDQIVGSSVGALNGAAIAHYGLEVGADVLTETWIQLHKRDIFPGGLLAQLVCLLQTRQSLFYQDELGKLIDGLNMAQSIEKLKIPLGILATDLTTHGGTLFQQGELRSALLASTAIPCIYPPVQIEGKLYVDGGCTEGVPLKAATQMGAGSIIILDAGMMSQRHYPPRHVGDLLFTVVEGALRQRLQSEAELIAQHLPIVYLPRPSRLNIGFMNFDHTIELIDRTEKLVNGFLSSVPFSSPNSLPSGIHGMLQTQENHIERNDAGAIGPFEVNQTVLNV